MTKEKRFIVSIIFGLFLTILLAIIAFMGESKRWVCTFAWQGCLMYPSIHTPDNPVHEGTVLDLIGYLFDWFGLLLGVPIYGGLTYLALSVVNKLKK